MGDCVHRVVGHLLAMGVPEVEWTMTDRIEELQAKVEEWNNLIKSQASSVSYIEIRDALTEALDIAEKMTNYLQVANRTNARRSQQLAEQERLLVRAKQLAQAVLTLPHRDFIPFAQRLLDDLDARSAT